MLKIILKFLKYLICIPIIAYILMIILIQIYIIIFVPVSMQSVVFKEFRYEIKRRNFCFNNCYSVWYCHFYENQCYDWVSFDLIYDTDKIVDIYIRNGNLHVVFKKKNANFEITSPYKCRKINDGNVFEECVAERDEYMIKYFIDAIKFESKSDTKNNIQPLN